MKEESGHVQHVIRHWRSPRITAERMVEEYTARVQIVPFMLLDFILFIYLLFLIGERIPNFSHRKSSSQIANHHDWSFVRKNSLGPGCLQLVTDGYGNQRRLGTEGAFI